MGSRFTGNANILKDPRRMLCSSLMPYFVDVETGERIFQPRRPCAALQPRMLRMLAMETFTKDKNRNFAAAVCASS